ncbi:MAG: agmatine deiminase family protein [Bacteroidia bacterium]|nr:agmatine deiminase family protein [Bacteroidia bacterium]
MKLYKLLLGVLALPASLNLTTAQQIKPFKKPAYQTKSEKALPYKSYQQDLFKAALFPKDIILPGEFEESQIVAISWSFDYDSTGTPTGADVSSVFGDISAQLANAIQKECAVWIRILNATDSTLILQHMINRGTPLVNYRFMVNAGDDWWTRDYGPMAFYSKNLDSIGFVDMRYYNGRENDNVFPAQLAQAMGYQNYTSPIFCEGGNLMGDGYGRLFFSDRIVDNNIGTVHSPSWTKQETLSTLTNLFNTPDRSNLVSLRCDGGTGHIDLYLKLIDEQTIIASQYPKEITAVDKQIIEDNVQLLTALKSTYNRPYRIVRIEHPTNDIGKHTNLTCTQIDADARNFINGLTVNNSFIFPSYYDGNTGNAAQHQRIMALYKRIMPGYNIVPIDSRDMSPLGGAIHCITMQIPAENPVRIWHPSVDGLVPALPKYHILMKAANKSGIQSASCYWRKNANSTWTNFSLTDSAGYWTGEITNANLTGSDSVEYYLTATSNNGKTVTKPITATKGGYYTMRTQYLSSLNDFVISSDHLFNAYPNPATQKVTISFKLIQSNYTEMQLIDLNGKLVFSKNFGILTEGLHETQINTSELAAGMYLYRLLINNKPMMSKRLVIGNN